MSENRPEPRRWQYPAADPSPPPHILDSVTVTWPVKPWHGAVHLRHEPTGCTAEGRTYELALTDLALQLVHRGHWTVNQARRALSMPEWATL
jgi:hypothetical protein